MGWRILAFSFLLGSGLHGQSSAPPRARPTGYLSVDQTIELIRAIPAPPKPGDLRDNDDRNIFKLTRSFQGTPRWALAANDNDVTVPAVLKDYSCSLGITITAENAPKVMNLVQRAEADGRNLMTRLKDTYKRKRPSLIDEGPLCIVATPAFLNTPDYPSGHATTGWTIGSILAELAPSRAAAILTRAAAFGESRVVCGLHNPSAVEAAHDTATAVITLLHGSPEFRADLEAARSELTDLLKAAPPKSESCQAEAALIANRPY